MERTMTGQGSHWLRCFMFLLATTAVALAQTAAKTPAPPVAQAQSLGIDWRQRGATGNVLVDDTPAINQAVQQQKQADGGQFNWPNNFSTRVRTAINASNTSDLTFVGTGPTSAV